jgi:hypothetical protein
MRYPHHISNAQEYITMGNRAVITTAPYSVDNVGIYVHWNGGRASVAGFLRAAKELGYRSPGEDNSYALARLTECIAAYFGPDGLSVGIDTCRNLGGSHADNGTYLIGGDWQIVGRKHWDDAEAEEINEAKTEEIARSIVAKVRAAAEAKAETAGA